MNICKKSSLALIMTALLVSAATAQAAVVFSDDFESNPSGLNRVPATWTVQAGTVDIVTGGFCLDGSSRCIDLDGSSGDAGVLSQDFLAVAGVTYTLSYQLSGNRRSGGDTVTVQIDGVNQSHTLAALDALQTFTLSFLANSTGSETFSFSNAGGDNVGLILDNVVLTSTTSSVPEPATLALLLAGLSGLRFSPRRSR